MQTDTSIKTHIEDMRSNKIQGLVAIYDLYAPSLYGIIKTHNFSDETAERILEHSFLKIWQQVINYHEKLAFFSWMIQIVNREIQQALDYR